MYSIPSAPKYVMDSINLPALADVRTALDFACGSGRIALALAMRGLEVTASDSAKAAIKRLKKAGQDLKTGSLRVFETDMYSLGCLEEFDLVVAWRLFHIGTSEGRSQLWEKLAHLVGLDRFALVAVASVECPSYSQRRNSPKAKEIEQDTFKYESFGDIHVKHYYSDVEARKTVQESGFQILDFASVREESGHPEISEGRCYWCMLLKKQGRM